MDDLGSRDVVVDATLLGAEDEEHVHQRVEGNISEQAVEEDAAANHTSESRIASVVEPDDTNLANPALAYTSQSGQTGDPSEVEAYFFKRSISAPSRASLASMFSYPRSKW